MEQEPNQEDGQELAAAISDRERICAALFERGLDDKDIVGLHGTSIEALQQLIATGNLPTGDGPGNEGYIYFYRPDEVESGLNETSIESYAQIHAFEDRFAAILGLDRQRDDRFIVAVWHAVETCARGGAYPDLTEVNLETLQAVSPGEYDRILEEYVQRIGIKPVMQAAADAVARNGVVIGLKTSIERFQPESVRSIGDEGHRIRVPEGIPLADIAGLEPVGQYEYDYFVQLQERVNR